MRTREARADEAGSFLGGRLVVLERWITSSPKRRSVDERGTPLLVVLSLATAVAFAGCSPWSGDARAERSTERWAEALGVRISNSSVLDHFQDMTQENLLLAAAEAGATVVDVEHAANSDSFYEWHALVVRLDPDTTLFAERTTPVCWRLLFEGGFYRSKSVVPCGDDTPLAIVAPEDEAVPDDAVDRVRRVLVDVGLGDDLRSRLESAFPELNPRNIKIIVIDGVYGVALDDGHRCVLARIGLTLNAWDVSSETNETRSCYPAHAVRPTMRHAAADSSDRS